MSKVMSFRTGWPEPCLYLKVTWSKRMLPSLTSCTGAWRGAGRSSRPGLPRYAFAEAADMEIMTKSHAQHHQSHQDVHDVAEQSIQLAGGQRACRMYFAPNQLRAMLQP